jgi:hypothetical protein
MATCGADGMVGTHVNAAVGLDIKEGTNEKQFYEGAVHTENKGMGPLDGCTWCKRLMQTDRTATCVDDIGRAGSRGAPHPAVCPGVQSHAAHREWHRQNA